MFDWKKVRRSHSTFSQLSAATLNIMSSIASLFSLRVVIEKMKFPPFGAGDYERIQGAQSKVELQKERTIHQEPILSRSQSLPNPTSTLVQRGRIWERTWWTLSQDYRGERQLSTYPPTPSIESSISSSALCLISWNYEVSQSTLIFILSKLENHFKSKIQ